jgi:hypothetical protein
MTNLIIIFHSTNPTYFVDVSCKVTEVLLHAFCDIVYFHI